MNKYEELSEYLSDNGFDESNYGTEADPCIYWHHDKCSDVLRLEDNGTIILFSCPLEIFNINIGLPIASNGNQLVTSKEDVDKLVKALMTCK